MIQIEGEAQIDFPTLWEFKIICTDKEATQKELFEFSHKEYELTFSKMSSGGKYTSLNYKIEIDNRDELKNMYLNLAKLESITRVI